VRGTAAEAAAYEGEVDRRIAAKREAHPDFAGAAVNVPAGTAPQESQMDASEGPLCGCGQPSTHESGWCGRKTCPTHCPLANGRPISLEDTARASLVAQVVSLAGALPSEDLHALAARLEGRTAALSWGERMRLRGRRASVTRSAEVGGTKVHVGTAADEAGEIREVWIDVAKEGSPVRGLLHAVAGLASIALQHGAPPAAVAKVMGEPAFDPAGAVVGAEEDGITSARSIPHYVAQVLTLGSGR
jgi:hypothetical protein